VICSETKRLIRITARSDIVAETNEVVKIFRFKSKFKQAGKLRQIYSAVLEVLLLCTSSYIPIYKVGNKNIIRIPSKMTALYTINSISIQTVSRYENNLTCELTTKTYIHSN
jgi:hypothetical protein